jgi:hypothetical protein
VPPAPTPAAPPPQSEKDARQQKTRRRHRGKAAEGEERNATPDLLLKHSDATLATYVCRHMKHLKHYSETLTKTSKNI